MYKEGMPLVCVRKQLFNEMECMKINYSNEGFHEEAGVCGCSYFAGQCGSNPRQLNASYAC
jgi:hypothetical protein